MIAWQSQVVEPKTSPVRQCEWTRTKGGVVARFGARNFAANERDVQLVVHVARIRDHAEVAVLRGKNGFGDPPHIAFVLHAVANQVGHGEKLQPVRAAELRQLRGARHRAVVVHDFADDAGMVQAGDAREVHGSFRLPGAHEHAAIARAQRVDVAGARQIFGARVRVGGRENCGGAVGGARAGGCPAARVNRLAEWRAEHRGVARSDRSEAQRVAALLGEREANQPAAKLRHEVDGFGRHFFRRHREVAFVFAVFVVHQDDHAALANFFDGFFDAGERRFALGHFSVSRLENYTQSPREGQGREARFVIV